MPLIDPAAAQRPEFVSGPIVRLADGREWSLPLRDPRRQDPEFDAILAMVAESSAPEEMLRAELALTIFLLTRNYDLSPESLDGLLRFEPGDPALVVLQHDVHAIAWESIRRLRSLPATPPASPHAAPASRARRFETT